MEVDGLHWTRCRKCNQYKYIEPQVVVSPDNDDPEKLYVCKACQ